MNTLKFLQTILPEEGFKFVGLGRVGRDGIAHKAYESLELMAQAIESYDAQNNLIVYHACCSYKAASYEAEVNGVTKTKFRGAQNWDKAKSFWIDIDCGEDKAAEGKGYLNKTEAAKAILGFCKTHQFPKPMLVDSGGGLHCYWPLTKTIGPNSWRDQIFGEFQNGSNLRVLVANPATMSHGLTLTAATNIIWFAPIHSNDIYEQACARVRRPGQTRTTVIAHIACSDIERRIYTRLRTKQKLQGALLEIMKGIENDEP